MHTLNLGEMDLLSERYDLELELFNYYHAQNVFCGNVLNCQP